MSTAAVTPQTADISNVGGAQPQTTAPASGNTQSQTPDTQQQQTQQPNQGADGIRQLREAYDKIKGEFEPYQKLGVKADQVGQFQTVYTKMYGEVASLGRELGYPDNEIAEAMAEDPVRTLDFLRTAAEQAQNGQQQPDNGQELNDLVSQHVQQVIGPIQQRENQRMTQEANSLFERTVHNLAVETFKAEGIDVANIPQDEMFMLTSAVSEILKYDEGALRSLKYEGKTAAVQQAFQEAKTYLDKYYLARSGRERTKIQAPARPGQPAPVGQKKFSLDEMIENPGVIGKQYA